MFSGIACNAATDSISDVVDEDLRLVLQAPERGRVQNAVAIPLKARAIGWLVLGVLAPARIAAPKSIGRQ